MRSGLVRALAAIALVAATSLDMSTARADGIPIHRGLPSDGYGEPDSGGGTLSLPLFFSILLPNGQRVLIGPHWIEGLRVAHTAQSWRPRILRQRTKS